MQGAIATIEENLDAGLVRQSSAESRIHTLICGIDDEELASHSPASSHRNDENRNGKSISRRPPLKLSIVQATSYE